ncbi:MAG: radical SAM protein [Kiritimatiellaeota bacterium]|nr:radical SAM protein [Kiritimatiellota bacterium]
MKLDLPRPALYTLTMRVLLITPPMVQLNAPYAATPALMGLLRAQGLDARQADLSLELALLLFSRKGLAQIRAALPRRSSAPAVLFFRRHAPRYAAVVDDAVRFLQGQAPALAGRLARRRWLPEGPRFAVATPAFMRRHFGPGAAAARAKYLASLFLDDLADVLRDGVDPRFSLARYAERLALAAATFDQLHAALQAPPTLVDQLLDRIVVRLIRREKPDLVGLTVPFPGNLYGALRIAQTVRHIAPRTKIVLGGGYVNTELCRLAEPRLFDFADFVTLDDGAQPLLALIEHLHGRRPAHSLCRTFFRRRGRVVFGNAGGMRELPFRDWPAPSYTGLDPNRYLSLCELPNPVIRLWSDGYWNRLQLARGCYWHRCAFCDTSLAYIRRFEPGNPDRIVDHIERLIAETGRRNFHFVDEAAPPALLRAVAERLLARGVSINWWTNIRFEKVFTPALARLLACAGCLAVTAGLETACNRTLRLMQKGVTVAQAARCVRAFAGAGILVHAYLIYGFPTQTRRETIAALEIVRTWFRRGWIQSAYWHRFALTIHSPMFRNPAAFGLRLARDRASAEAGSAATPNGSRIARRQTRAAPAFAQNEITYEEAGAPDWDALGAALRTATYNYLHGLGLDGDVRAWFDLTTDSPLVRRPRSRRPS